MFEAVALVLWIFLFLGIWYAYGNICIAPFFLGTAAKVVMASVDSASTTPALHIIVAIFGFDFIAADITENGIFDNQYEFSFVKSSWIRCVP